MSWSLSILLFSIIHTVMPYGLCRITGNCLEGCSVSSYAFVGVVSIYGLINVMENVLLVDLHSPSVYGFSRG